MQDNNRKVIVLTGASKGIGKAIAEKEGQRHHLSLFSRSESEMKSILQSQDPALKSIYTVGDIKKEDDIRLCVEKTLQTFVRIDVLINNAWIGIFKLVDQFTYEEFDEIQKVNVYGSFLFTKYSLPNMIENKSGYIINISSVAGLNGFKTGTAYSASKFALNGFTESLREDVKQYGIGVCSICPGGVKTEFGGKGLEKFQGNDFLLEPEDVARTVSYLIDESETSNTKLIELKPRRRKEYRGK